MRDRKKQLEWNQRCRQRRAQQKLCVTCGDVPAHRWHGAVKAIAKKHGVTPQTVWYLRRRKAT